MKGIKTLFSQIALTLMVLALPSMANAGLMYLANNGSDNLYKVDVTTGIGTFVGNAGINLGFGGLGFATDGTLYGYTTSTNSLYTVNKTSGAWSLVGPSGTTAGDSFDIDPTTGKGYVTSFNGLHELDLNTGGVLSTVAAAPFFPGSAFASDGTYFTTNNGLSTLDVLTGIDTIVGPGESSARSLAYNPTDGMLYTVGYNTGILFRIDPNSGIATNLGALTGVETGGQWTMATFDVAGSTVPEPSTLALLGIGLLGLGLKRRRQLKV